MRNKKGFTLIELLAVIVILGVLLAIAIPSVTKYINNSKKDTYIQTAKQYIEAVRYNIVSNIYQYPVNTNQATLVKFSTILPNLEKGGKTSSYGGTFNPDNSFVLIVNTSTSENPKYEYYVTALDSKGYGIGTIENNAGKAELIEYNALTSNHVVQMTTGVAMTILPEYKIGANTIKITNSY